MQSGLVGRGDIGKVGAQQRAQMAVDEFVGDGVVLVFAGEQNRPARADGDGN
jgi:hypothetical protein